jgi:hypothetical protein
VKRRNGQQLEDNARRQFADNWASFDEALKKEQNNVTIHPTEDHLVAELTAATETYRRLGKKFFEPALDKGVRNEDYYAKGGLYETFLHIKETAGKVMDLNQNQIKLASKRASATARSSLLWLALVSRCVRWFSHSWSGRPPGRSFVPFELSRSRRSPSARVTSINSCPWSPTMSWDRWPRRSSTRRNLEVCKARLVEFFGKDKNLRDITAGDADAFLVSLKGQYAEATIGRTIRRAQQFFRNARRKKIIAENPFQDVKAPAQTNEARKAFVARQTVSAVLEACPDAEWRLIVALSRYGALRCPSEHLVLQWADVDWERDRFRVDSPKTGERWVPSSRSCGRSWRKPLSRLPREARSSSPATAMRRRTSALSSYGSSARLMRSRGRSRSTICGLLAKRS